MVCSTPDSDLGALSKYFMYHRMNHSISSSVECYECRPLDRLLQKLLIKNWLPILRNATTTNTLYRIQYGRSRIDDALIEAL